MAGIQQRAVAGRMADGFPRSHGEGVFRQRADESERERVAHGGIDFRTEQDVGAIGHEFLQALHEEFDFKQGEVLAAAEVNEHGLRFLEERALIEQGAGKRVAQGLGGAVLALGEAGAEEAARAVGAQCAHQIIEADVDEAGANDEADDGLDRLGDHVVRGSEGFVDALFGEHEFAHAVVVEGDEGVGEDGEFVESGFGLVAGTLPFEGEGHGGEDDNEGSFFAGDAGNDGSRAGTGAAAETGAEEHDAAAFHSFPDFIFGFEHGLVAEFGIAAGAEAFGEVHAELDLFFGEAGAEGADVGVEREQLGAVQAVEGDAFQHVGASAAEADDFDGRGGNGLMGIAGVGNHREFEI